MANRRPSERPSEGQSTGVRARAIPLACALVAASCVYDYEGALSASSTGDGGDGGAPTGVTTTNATSGSSSVGSSGAGGDGGSSSGDGGASSATTSAAGSTGDAASSSDASTAETATATSASTGEPFTCPGTDFTLPNGQQHCFRILTPRTWDQARTQCQAISMHLASFDLTESELLRASGHIGEATWTGGRRQGNTTTFDWVVAEPFPPGPPWNDPAEAGNGNGDDCVTFLVDGTWGLRSCDNVVPALCETF